LDDDAATSTASDALWAAAFATLQRHDHGVAVDTELVAAVLEGSAAPSALPPGMADAVAERLAHRADPTADNSAASRSVDGGASADPAGFDADDTAREFLAEARAAVGATGPTSLSNELADRIRKLTPGVAAKVVVALHSTSAPPELATPVEDLRTYVTVSSSIVAAAVHGQPSDWIAEVVDCVLAAVPGARIPLLVSVLRVWNRERPGGAVGFLDGVFSDDEVADAWATLCAPAPNGPGSAPARPPTVMRAALNRLVAHRRLPVLGERSLRSRVAPSSLARTDDGVVDTLLSAAAATADRDAFADILVEATVHGTQRRRLFEVDLTHAAADLPAAVAVAASGACDDLEAVVESLVAAAAGRSPQRWDDDELIDAFAAFPGVAAAVTAGLPSAAAALGGVAHQLPRWLLGRALEANELSLWLAADPAVRAEFVAACSALDVAQATVACTLVAQGFRGTPADLAEVAATSG
jgi:hypothetical protein